MRNDWLKKARERGIRSKSNRKRLKQADTEYVGFVCPNCKAEDTVENDPFITDYLICLKCGSKMVRK